MMTRSSELLGLEVIVTAVPDWMVRLESCAASTVIPPATEIVEAAPTCEPEKIPLLTRRLLAKLTLFTVADCLSVMGAAAKVLMTSAPAMGICPSQLEAVNQFPPAGLIQEY